MELKEKKHKVLHLLGGNRFSGAEIVVCNIIRMFEQCEMYEMVYCSPDEYGEISANLQNRKVNFIKLENFSKKEIARAIKYYKPDIIHAHDWKASIMAAKYRKIPIISHLHSNPPWQKSVNIKSIFFATRIHYFDKIYGVSQSVYDEFVFRKLYKNKFEVLPNIINKNNILDLSKEDVATEDFSILFVGRLTAPKNPLYFLNIIFELKNRGYKIKALMLGDGELRTECEQYIAEKHLKHEVKLYGFVDNPYPFMKKAKVLVVPSVYEGFGLVAIEAMLLGTPVVCSNVGGLKDIVDNECGGVCLNMNDYICKIVEIVNSESTVYSELDKKAEKFCNIEKYKECLHLQYASIYNMNSE